MAVNNIERQLKDKLYDSIRGILDRLGFEKVPVIFAYETGVEPKDTYCSIYILNRERFGRVQETVGSPLDRESENFYTNYYKILVQVGFIGNQSDEVMAEFEDSVFSSRQCIHILQRNLLGPIRQSDSRYIGQLRESKWVKQYNIDLELSYAVQSHEEIDWIDEVFVRDLIFEIIEESAP